MLLLRSNQKQSHRLVPEIGNFIVPTGNNKVTSTSRVRHTSSRSFATSKFIFNFQSCEYVTQK